MNDLTSAITAAKISLVNMTGKDTWNSTIRPRNSAVLVLWQTVDHGAVTKNSPARTH